VRSQMVDGFNGSVIYKIISSSVRLMMSLSEIISTCMVSSRNSIIISTY
jgi:hypothetical protein